MKRIAILGTGAISDSHLPAHLKLADRAYILETGELTISGTTEELRGSDEIVQRYLGGH